MHTTTSNGAALEPLPVRQRKLSAAGAGQYRVTEVGGKTHEIAANTAYEAFKISGLKQAIKIERAFSSSQTVYDKSQLLDEPAPVTPAASAPNLGLVQRAHPILSADELDALMKAARDAIASAGTKVTESSTPLPVPEAPAATNEAPSADLAGTQVHREGFDEIIPAAPSPVKQAAKHTEAKTTAETTAPVTPAEALSPEEVDKLLGGK